MGAKFHACPFCFMQASFCANNWAITMMEAKPQTELKCTLDFVDVSQTIKIDNFFYTINL